MSVKKEEVVFSLWVKKMPFEDIENLKGWIRKTLGFSEKIEIDYMKHPKMKLGKTEEILKKQVIYIKKAQ
jgi:hypothetical protein